MTRACNMEKQKRDLALLLFSGIGRNMLFQSFLSIDALLSQSCWPHSFCMSFLLYDVL